MLKFLILCVLGILIVIYVLFATRRKQPLNMNYPCNQELTDDEYINHMITHHEVAVYMSESHLKNIFFLFFS